MTPSIISRCSGASSSRVFFKSGVNEAAASQTRLGWSRRIGDEIPRRQPQFVDAPVDLLGEIADALQALQFGEGRIDVADGDDAGDARHRDHRQQQHEAAKVN